LTLLVVEGAKDVLERLGNFLLLHHLLLFAVFVETIEMRSLRNQLSNILFLLLHRHGFHLLLELLLLLVRHQRSQFVKLTLKLLMMNRLCPTNFTFRLLLELLLLLS